MRPCRSPSMPRAGLTVTEADRQEQLPLCGEAPRSGSRSAHAAGIGLCSIRSEPSAAAVRPVPSPSSPRPAPPAGRPSQESRAQRAAVRPSEPSPRSARPEPADPTPDGTAPASRGQRVGDGRRSPSSRSEQPEGGKEKNKKAGRRGAAPDPCARRNAQKESPQAARRGHPLPVGQYSASPPVTFSLPSLLPSSPAVLRRCCSGASATPSGRSRVPLWRAHPGVRLGLRVVCAPAPVSRLLRRRVVLFRVVTFRARVLVVGVVGMRVLAFPGMAVLSGWLGSGGHLPGVRVRRRVVATRGVTFQA